RVGRAGNRGGAVPLGRRDRVVAVAAVEIGRATCSESDRGAAGRRRGEGDRAGVGARGGQVARTGAEAAGVAGTLAEGDGAAGPDSGAGVRVRVVPGSGAGRALIDLDRVGRAGNRGGAVPLGRRDRVVAVAAV